MDSTGSEAFGIFIVTILVLIVIFVLIREFWCWFFKINEISAHLKKIVSLLESGAMSTATQTPYPQAYGTPTADLFISNRLMRIVGETMAYSQPTTTSAANVKLSPGTTIHVDHTEGQWAQVFLPENKTQPLGWVHISNLDAHE